MPRRVPGLAPNSLIAYVPKHDGNDTDPAPVKVFIRAPTQGEKRDYMIATVKTLRIASVEGEVKLEFSDVLDRQRRFVETFVVSVEGYEDQHGVPITDAAGLWERGELVLAGEVADYIASLLNLDETQRKNSKGSSGSPQATTPVSAGTAAPASHAGTPSTATATAQAIEASNTPSAG